MAEMPHRKKLRQNIQTTGPHKSTTLSDHKEDSLEYRSKAIDRTITGYHNNSQTIEQIYGRVNRFRTLRREKGDKQPNDKSKELLNMALNNAKIENSFNNIIINFSERESLKGSLMGSINPRPHQDKLLYQRNVKSKDPDRSVKSRRYAHSKVLSQRADQISSSSLAVKEKVYLTDKLRLTSKTSHHKARKSEVQTLQEQFRPSSRTQKDKKKKNNSIEQVIGNFVSKFQSILQEPISLETYETKQMKMEKKMRKSGIRQLELFFRRRLKQTWVTLCRRQSS